MYVNRADHSSPSLSNLFKIFACLHPSRLVRKTAQLLLKRSTLIDTSIFGYPVVLKKRKFVYSLVLRYDHLNLDVQRPITSPWHTNSALNSDPSSVR